LKATEQRSFTWKLARGAKQEHMCLNHMTIFHVEDVSHFGRKQDIKALAEMTTILMTITPTI
jgi:hypothetical protein